MRSHACTASGIASGSARRGRPLHAVLIVLCTLTLPPFSHQARGQGSATADSALQRLERLARDGNLPAARAVADSVLRVARDLLPQYGEALYWRATLSEDVERARRDYLRLAVDFPRHPRIEDALLRLAQIEFTRSDRTSARRYLERLRLEHPNGKNEAQAAYWMGRVLLEQGEMVGACGALTEARMATRSADVEFVNQIAYYARQCQGAAHAPSTAAADSVARADSLARPRASPGRALGIDSVGSTSTGAENARVPRAAATRASDSPKRPGWSVQVAAYSSRAEASALAVKLTQRGYDARVTSTAPFRVRIGRFAARSSAVSLVATLRASRMSAIVVEAERQ